MTNNNYIPVNVMTPFFVSNSFTWLPLLMLLEQSARTKW